MRMFTKTALAAIAIMAFSTLSNAQRRQFEEGQSDLNVGIGFVTFGLEGDVVVPPLSLSYEYGISDKISVGAFVGYTATTFNYPSVFTPGGTPPSIDFTYLIVAARASYHFKLMNDLDTYVGVMIGYNNATVGLESNDFPLGFEPSFDVGGVFYGFYGGARYHFTDNLGAFLEVGYGVSAVNIGLAVKF